MIVNGELMYLTLPVAFWSLVDLESAERKAR